MRTNNAISAYSQLDLENSVESRSPTELIVLLFEKACDSVLRASLLPVDQLDSLPLDDRLNTIDEFHKSTAKALQILTGLRGILDRKQGGELAKQLEETYSILISSIWTASRKKDLTSMHKNYLALSELRQAWTEISKTAVAS